MVMLVSLASAGCMSVRQRVVVYERTTEVASSPTLPASTPAQLAGRSDVAPPVVVVGSTSATATAPAVAPLDTRSGAIVSFANNMLIAIGFDSLRSIAHEAMPSTGLDVGVAFVSGVRPSDGVQVTVCVITGRDEATAAGYAEAFASRGAVARRGDIVLVVASTPDDARLDQAILARLVQLTLDG